MEAEKNAEALLKEYEQLKTTERGIQKRIKELAPMILPLIPDDKEIQGESGFFYIQKKAKWSYSEEVKGIEKNLKEIKKQEENDGTAKVEYNPVLYYRTEKPEEE